ncbi:MAG TPA: hypothetical protein VF942_00205, partial [Acidimicrobiales bacterium]
GPHAAAPGGNGGSPTLTNTAAPAENHGNATGTQSATSGDQINSITNSGQCASNGVNVGGQNTGVVNNGNGNKVLNNSGDVLGVLIQNQGGSKGAGKGAGGGPTTTINSVNNFGNTNGQAVVGGRNGSTVSPNQNSSQNFNQSVHP